MVTMNEISYKDERLGFFADQRKLVQKRYNRLEKQIKPDEPYTSERKEFLSDLGRELSFYNDVIEMLENGVVPKSETAKEIFDAAKDEDELALLIVRKSMRYLAKAMANVSAVIDPEAFIIGGGVSKAGQFMIDIIKEEYEKAAFKGNKDKLILTARLGENAGIFGAAAKLIEMVDGERIEYAFYCLNEKDMEY